MKARSLAYLLRILIAYESETRSLRLISPHPPFEINF